MNTIRERVALLRHRLVNSMYGECSTGELHQKVADHAGVTAHHVRNVLRGHKNLSPAAVKRLEKKHKGTDCTVLSKEGFRMASKGGKKVTKKRKKDTSSCSDDGGSTSHCDCGPDCDCGCQDRVVIKSRDATVTMPNTTLAHIVLDDDQVEINLND